MACGDGIEVVIPEPNGTDMAYTIADRDSTASDAWHMREDAESLALDPPSSVNVGTNVWLDTPNGIQMLAMKPALQEGCVVTVCGTSVTIGNTTYARSDKIRHPPEFTFRYRGPTTPVGHVTRVNPDSAPLELSMVNPWTGEWYVNMNDSYIIDGGNIGRILLLPRENPIAWANDAAYQPRSNVHYNAAQYNGRRDNNNAVIELLYTVSAEGTLTWVRRVVIRLLRNVKCGDELFIEYGADYWLQAEAGAEPVAYQEARKFLRMAGTNEANSKMRKRNLHDAGFKVDEEEINRIIAATRATEYVDSQGRKRGGIRFGNRRTNEALQQNQLLADTPDPKDRPLFKQGNPREHRSWTSWLIAVINWVKGRNSDSGNNADDESGNADTEETGSQHPRKRSRATYDDQIALPSAKRTISNTNFVVNSQLQSILNGDLSIVNAEWKQELSINEDSWSIRDVPGKGLGIVVTKVEGLKQNAYIAVYGGKVVERTRLPPSDATHALDIPQSGKLLAIDGRDAQMLPKLARAALANTNDRGDRRYNAFIAWKNPLKGEGSQTNRLFDVPLLRLRRDVQKDEEITIWYGQGFPPALDFRVENHAQSSK